MSELQIGLGIVVVVIVGFVVWSILRVGARADGVDRHECGDSGWWQPKETRE